MDEEKKEPEAETEEKPEEKPAEEVEKPAEKVEEVEEKAEEVEENAEEKPAEKPAEEKVEIEKKKKRFFRFRKATPAIIPEITPEEKLEIEPEVKEAKEKPKPAVIEPKPRSEKPKERIRISGSEWYDKNYKKLLFISLGILIAALVYIFIFGAIHGDIMHKDVSLTGGTVITIYTDKAIDIEAFETELESRLEKTVSVRTLEDITTRRQIAVIIETQAESESAEAAIEEMLDLELTSENSSIEISGASLSQAFYRQLRIAIIIAFIFMAIVVFIIFKSPIPSLAVVMAAITDLAGALAIANLFGFKISTAGIAAFLMLIGYSVDTDIMLTTKVLKRRGEAVLNTRIFRAAKTGLMMTLTSFIAVLMGFFIAQSPVLKQIFFILSAGLFIDLLSTWLGNASILKWYCKRKKIS